VGFEPTVLKNTPVFKTGTLNHSVIHPNNISHYIYIYIIFYIKINAKKLMSVYNISIINHIKEFKYRMAYVVISGILTFFVAYIYSLELFYFFAKPLINLKVEDFEYSLIYTDITEAFFTYLNLSLYISITFSFLFLIHQITFFLIPGLYSKEAKLVKKIKYIIYFSCIISTIITYFLMIPFIWHFFISNETSNTISSMNIHFEGKLNEYIYILLRVFFSILCVFISPLILFILVRLKIVSLNILINQRKIAFILIFILGALLSPPDVISQILLAIPLCISYELIIFIILFNKNN
jgi:sec-independent protein translocase protein TatC